MSDPCKCLNSWAYISPTHSGHCCFLPATQECHASEVAAWEVEVTVTGIGTPYSTIKLCQHCDVCDGLGCLDDHGLCVAVNPEETEGCFREPDHEGLHTFEIKRAVTEPKKW